MAAILQGMLASSLMILMLVGPISAHSHGPDFKVGPWKDAHATFYGGADGSGTMGGACGYDDLVKEGYGFNTTALSTALFNDGKACGSCYEIKCAKGNKWCKPGARSSIFVTATNFCPPGGTGCCNSPNEHFDLSQPAYLQIAEYKAGIVPVQYRRVPCKKRGGVKLTITGNPYFNLVTVTNVGGAGDVTSVEVSGGKDLPWTKLSRNWGQKWETNANLVGHDLTFKVTTSDGKTVILQKVVPQNWQFSQTFEGQNFM
ncbi:hypothetical protein ACP275_10G100500 [Erythranthe tilingii]